MPSLAVAGVAAAVMGPANWLFISCLGWGLAGAAASYFVGSLASLAVIVVFIVRLERKRPLEARCAGTPSCLLLVLAWQVAGIMLLHRCHANLVQLATSENPV